MRHKIDAVLFDKDGTLFDFSLTWSAWAQRVLVELAGGDRAQGIALGDAIGFDLENGVFDPASPAIAGTPREQAELLAPLLPDMDVEQITQRMVAAAIDVPLVEAAPLAAVLGELRELGLKLGVCTNDAEVLAHDHLRVGGVTQFFDFVAGYDSGYGAKPDPGPLLAFAKAMDIAPEGIVMVGDSTHDLIAAKAAGMQRVGVLTGLALADDLAPYADVVMPNVGGLPAWLAS